MTKLAAGYLDRARIARSAKAKAMAEQQKAWTTWQPDIEPEKRVGSAARLQESTFLVEQRALLVTAA
jgi:hypothetical protein